MARLTLAEAARLVRLSPTSLYRAIADGRLTREPDGTIDTAELLRAGFVLHNSAEQGPASGVDQTTIRGSRTLIETVQDTNDGRPVTPSRTPNDRVQDNVTGRTTLPSRSQNLCTTRHTLNGCSMSWSVNVPPCSRHWQTARRRSSGSWNCCTKSSANGSACLRQDQCGGDAGPGSRRGGGAHDSRDSRGVPCTTIYLSQRRMRDQVRPSPSTLLAPLCRGITKTCP